MVFIGILLLDLGIAKYQDIQGRERGARIARLAQLALSSLQSDVEAVSDLAWLAEAGIPGLLYGPGDAAQAHGASEYLEIDDLVAATKVVALALVEWCGA